MKKKFLYSVLFLCSKITVAQFAPPAGQIGTTAMSKDSTAFIAWATGCVVTPGLMDVSDTTLGYAATGTGASAIGIAGAAGVVSLGDGGSAVLTFNNPIKDDAGYDFAVFENAFSDTFLELAFVEVSSNGVDFYRFPATSNTPDTLQTGSFGSTDATLINNLAGKYRALFGTPFDLQELASQPGLNINQITHIKIIDVIGAVNDTFSTYDQYGHKVNDPWNTPFASSGFDLDAVGVIHEYIMGINEQQSIVSAVAIYPNPVQQHSVLNYYLKQSARVYYTVTDISGKEIYQSAQYKQTEGANSIQLILPEWSNGIYFLKLNINDESITKKIVVTNE